MSPYCKIQVKIVTNFFLIKKFFARPNRAGSCFEVNLNDELRLAHIDHIPALQKEIKTLEMVVRYGKMDASYGWHGINREVRLYYLYPKYPSK